MGLRRKRWPCLGSQWALCMHSIIFDLSEVLSALEVWCQGIDRSSKAQGPPENRGRNSLPGQVGGAVPKSQNQRALRQNLEFPIKKEGRGTLPQKRVNMNLKNCV